MGEAYTENPGGRRGDRARLLCGYSFEISLVSGWREQIEPGPFFSIGPRLCRGSFNPLTPLPTKRPLGVFKFLLPPPVAASLDELTGLGEGGAVAEAAGAVGVDVGQVALHRAPLSDLPGFVQVRP